MFNFKNGETDKKGGVAKSCSVSGADSNLLDSPSFSSKHPHSTLLFQACSLPVLVPCLFLPHAWTPTKVGLDFFYKQDSEIFLPG